MNDANQPATKQDIREAIETLTTTIQTTIQTAIQGAEERAQEFTRGIETNLLTAFHGHAKGQTARLHTAETTTHDMGIRMAALEERVLNLETRRPPQ